MNMAKEETKKLTDKLPDQANRDDIMIEFYLRKKWEGTQSIMLHSSSEEY